MDRILTLKQFQDLAREIISLEPYVEVVDECFQMGNEDRGIEKEAWVKGFSRHAKPGYEITFDWIARGNLDGYLIDMFDFTIEPFTRGEYTPVFKGAVVLDDYKEPFEGHEVAAKIMELVSHEEWTKWIVDCLPEPRMLVQTD
ncbi:hypothetical protein [Maridesulfovibrio sp.]|uniref:hypothetical protein n=1 Tax=Maridesulfovibrio sp. TaxID=2795000 RepID=UPI002A18A9AC|nr:hypothetical protein [Maridesulfovibrio sp.]